MRLVYFTPVDLDVDAICLTMMGAAEHEISNSDAIMTFIRVRQHDDWNKVEKVIRSRVVDGWLP